MILHRAWRSLRTWMHQQSSAIHLLSVLIAILGAAHIYIRTSNYGPNITGDSLVYTSVAENLATGNGFLDFSQSGFYQWVPLFPLLLAVLIPLEIDPVDAGRFINIAGSGILLWISCNWLSRYLKNPILIPISVIAILLSYPLTSIPSYLLTETLFMVFVLLALIKISLFLQSPNPSRSALAWAASFTALASMTRYLGITVTLTGIIIVMIHPGFSTLRSKLRYTIFYTTISSIPLMVWICRNYISIGYPTGKRSYPDSINSLNAIYDVLRQWVWLDDPQSTFQIWIIGIIVLVLGRLFFLRKSSRAKSYSSLNLESLPKAIASWKITITFGLFFIVYLVTFLISISVLRSVGGIGQVIDRRYMAPIYIPALLLIVVWLDRLLAQTGRLTVTRWAIICLMSLGLFSNINISLQENIKEISEYSADDSKVILWGFSSDSEIMDYLRKNLVDGQIFSNENSAIYWLASRPSQQISASSDLKYVLPIPEYTNDKNCLAWIKGLVLYPTAYLVYFHNDRLMSCPFPEFIPNLLLYTEEEFQTSEAVVYRITSSSDLAFHVGMDAKTVTYTKRPCSLADTDTSARFYLHIFPVDSNLSNLWHYDDIKFDFADHGSMSGDECIIKIALPNYDISEIYTGQFVECADSECTHIYEKNATIWETKITPPIYSATRDNGVSAAVMTVPEAPSGLSAISGDGWITLSWNDPNDSSITNYQFREQPSYERDWWCWNSIQRGQTTFRTEGLPQGTTFRIQVRAQNAAGAGPSSEVLVSTTAVSSPVPIPAAPAGLTGTPGDQSIILSWENPSDSTIMGYQTREYVTPKGEYVTREDGWRCWRRHRGNRPDATLSLDSLTNDWMYRIQLRALNAAGTGPISQVAAIPNPVPPSP